MPTAALASCGVFAKQPPRPSSDAHRQPAANEHAQRGADALGAAQPCAHRAKQQQGRSRCNLRTSDATSTGEQHIHSAMSPESLCSRCQHCSLSDAVVDAAHHALTAKCFEQLLQNIEEGEGRAHQDTSQPDLLVF